MVIDSEEEVVQKIARNGSAMPRSVIEIEPLTFDVFVSVIFSGVCNVRKETPPTRNVIKCQ